MPELLAALDAFMQEHRRCGAMDGGVEDDRVWMACECGAIMVKDLGGNGVRTGSRLAK